MTTQHVTCSCGAQINEHVESTPCGYVITFTDAATGHATTSCPGCRRSLYYALRAGDLRIASRSKTEYIDGVSA